MEDYRLVEFALRLPLGYKLRGNEFKRILKDAVRDLIPAEVLTRPKWGFTPPASRWLRTALRPLVERWLAPGYVGDVGWFRPDAVKQVVDAHLAGEYQLWAVWMLLMFHLWHAVYIDCSLRIDAPPAPADLYAAATVR
ncbi:MAG: hypothetical protein HC828_11575 [Blastochloris sp.]|nr:hypothetical protein [Blastochloris sp.]